MDLFAAEQRIGKGWNLARQGAFVCFLLACVLLAVSLVVSEPRDLHGDTLAGPVGLTW